MNFSVIVTVGPAILNQKKLQAIDALGKCIYRINGAHVNPEQARNISATIRACIPDSLIMLDLPGNKVRTHNLSEPIRLIKGEAFSLMDYQINYPELRSHVKPGDMVYANDSIYTMEIVETTESAIRILSHSDGLLANNKGLHIMGIHEKIPFLFARDEELIKVACELDLGILSLSFVRNAEDIKLVKEKLSSYNKPDMQLFAKIETAAAVQNLGYIFQEVDSINLDRGDLSTDIGLLKLPLTQERIIASASRAGCNMFLATQFLKNMETSPIPLIAELTSLHETIKSGISGIQLSEETAVGKYPLECVKLIFDIYNSSFIG